MTRSITAPTSTTRDRALRAPRRARTTTPRRWQGQLARIVRARRCNGLQPPPPLNERPLLSDGTPDPDAFIFERKDWQRRWVAGWPGSGEQHGLHRAALVILVVLGVILGLAALLWAVTGVLGLLGVMW